MPTYNEPLLSELARRGDDAKRVAALARLIGPIERMEYFLSGREPGDHFKRGYTDKWWRIRLEQVRRLEGARGR